MINCKIVVTRDLEKQTLITNTPQSPTLKENTPSVKLRKKICLFICNDQWKLSRNKGKRVLKVHLKLKYSHVRKKLWSMVWTN